MSIIDIRNNDCLIEMESIADQSIDMILCDLPYGTTACKWDSIIPIDSLWSLYKRIIKKNGAIVLTAAQPFTTVLISSNFNDFRYDLKWIKKAATGFYNANRMPLRAHEDILVFYKSLPTYNPQKTQGKPYRCTRGSASHVYVGKDLTETNNESGERFPLSWVEIKRDKEKLHPTQKPVALMEYLIRTYTNENDVVLDNCMGSGTTGVACVNSGRHFVGIEKDPEYFRIAKERIEEAMK